MADDRIVRALREGPPDEPIYHSAQIRRTLAAPVRPATRRSHGAFRLAAGGFQLATVTVIAVVLVAALLLNEHARVGTTPSPSGPDLMEQVHRNGFIRFAIRPDFPQAQGTGLDGFDVDIAKAIATRLSVADHTVQLHVDQILGAGSTDLWDLGLPSALLPADQAAGFASSDPYYYWPVYLVSPKATAGSAATDLGGQRICVTTSSSGEAWLSGHLGPSLGPVVTPPVSPVVQTEATDWDCLAALTSGAVDAMVTSTLSDSDLAARPTLRTVGGPLFVEPRTIVASREGPDPSALLSAIDAALGAMRSDGSLADLARNRFGGRDLSIPPTSP